jgi:hypothetical protein
MYPVRYVTGADLSAAADDLGVSIDVIRAVRAVEARGSGFIADTDLPVILFEGHKFHAQTGGRFDGVAPHLSHPGWTKQFYKGGRGEYDRLLEAIRLNNADPDPALKATSWGMFQIMGFNHAQAGYATVREFVNDVSTGEDAQLRGFIAFVKADKRLLGSLQGQDWERFARAYNGAGYKANAYDTKLAAEFARQRRRSEAGEDGALDLERGDAMALQAALNARLRAGLTVDGWIGNNTRKAIRQFEATEGLPETGLVTAALAERLGLDLQHYIAAEG